MIWIHDKPDRFWEIWKKKLGRMLVMLYVSWHVLDKFCECECGCSLVKFECSWPNCGGADKLLQHLQASADDWCCVWSWGCVHSVEFQPNYPCKSCNIFFRRWDLCLLEVRCYYGRVDRQLDDSGRLGVYVWKCWRLGYKCWWISKTLKCFFQLLNVSTTADE